MARGLGSLGLADLEGSLCGAGRVRVLQHLPATSILGTFFSLRCDSGVLMIRRLGTDAEGF